MDEMSSSNEGLMNFSMKELKVVKHGDCAPSPKKKVAKDWVRMVFSRDFIKHY